MQVGAVQKFDEVGPVRHVGVFTKRPPPRSPLAVNHASAGDSQVVGIGRGDAKGERRADLARNGGGRDDGCGDGCLRAQGRQEVLNIGRTQA